MTCSEAIKHFHEFMDKELDKSHYLIVKKHIDNCEDCHKKYTYEMNVRSLVKTCCAKTTAPVYLYGRIINSLDSVDFGVLKYTDREKNYQEKIFRTSFLSYPFTIAASILISIAGGIFYYAKYYQTDSTAIVENAVKNHVVAVNDNLVFNEKTSVVENINKYLGNTINTRLSNSSPFLNAEQVSIKEGMPVRSCGTSSPCVIFDKGGNKLSLQVVRKGSFPIANLERVQLGHKEFYIGNRQGFNSVLWEEGGVAYCLTSDLNKNEMLRFAATLTSQ
ncbi:Anti-sigma factor RsrA [Candidatus Brocadiaceae bacterium B188]|nr:mycothiol system anti-sigma-R factor [Candidatus Brocadia sapporoensis]OQZ02958.1 MAG: mycothiol system anti-sigma-R factor [Candidatus Brocadia sp. UTAMX1]RZV59004.1 MAG: mycothiol system anti-sigma-R factor [Candidatus Brocadia sp. BROELEC01]TWU52433.1 Anti-sigma factor RsrA [Candidatus Brocadiaceae bacterium B188]